MAASRTMTRATMISTRPPFALLLLALSACSQADNPKDVADKYWQALRNGDIETARGLVSSDSRQAFRSFVESPENLKAVGEVELGAQFTRVVTVLYPVHAPDDYRAFDTLLVLENGEWKIDAEHTLVPPAGAESTKDADQSTDQLSQSMQDNIDSMEKSMKENLKMLHETVREGSREMGESLLKGMQELNRSMHDAIEQMRERRDRESPPPARPDSPASNGQDAI
jgi:hypothetical protein